MGAEQVFKVLTEFRFDIAHAVAGSQQLQGQIGQVSAAADELHYALKRASMGLVVQTGLGTGGFLGAIWSAVKAADKFEQSQRQIANVLLSNNLFTGPNAFRDAMNDAAIAMDHMNKVANQFSLPSADLVQFSKLVGATLVAHGLDNSHLEKSINLSRGFLKSAPTLGIDPGLAQGQLLDAVMGRANMGDTLFQRISNETSAMKPYQGTAGANSFNALTPAKRLEVLTQSLTQFGNVTEIVNANALSLTSQMKRLQDNITGMFSILRPIGKAIMDPLRKILYQLNIYLEKYGKKILEIMGRIFKDLLKDPEKLYTQIQQLRNLGKDTKMAGNILGIVALIHGIGSALKFLGISLSGNFLMIGLRSIGSAVAWVVTALGGPLAVLGFVLRGVWFIASKVVAPLVLLTTILQGISRGIAGAKISDMKWIAERGVKIAETFEKFKSAIEKILLPFELAIRGIAMFIEWLFSFGRISQWVFEKIQGLADMMETLGNIMVTFFGIIAGISNVMVNTIMNLMEGNFLAAGSNFGANFMEGFNDFTSEFWGKRIIGGGEQSTSTNKIEIDKIEINNQFKENAEPDRIAFTLKDQLMKAALNPTQAAGGSLRGKGIAF